MQTVVLNGTPTEAEQDYYVRQAAKANPMCVKLFLDVQDGHADVRLHHYRSMRKTGGCCIGGPSGWNAVQQAEWRGAVPSKADL